MSLTSHPVNVRFADIDSVGHVNHTKYLTYFEDARIAWFNEIIGKEWDWTKKGLILARIEVDYIKQVKFGEEVVVKTRCTRLGTKSFDHRYELYRTGVSGDELVAKGLAVLVCYDYETKQSCPIPEQWIAAIGSI